MKFFQAAISKIFFRKVTLRYLVLYGIYVVSVYSLINIFFFYLNAFLMLVALYAAFVAGVIMVARIGIIHIAGIPERVVLDFGFEVAWARKIEFYVNRFIAEFIKSPEKKTREIWKVGSEIIRIRIAPKDASKEVRDAPSPQYTSTLPL